MTIEEIKKEIKRLYDETNVSPYDEYEFAKGYEVGKKSAYRDCLKLLDKCMEADNGNH